MIFTRSKKLVFTNNKGGVGKTTLAYNCAVEFASNGYKTVLVDLDPQCNLTLLTLGQDFFNENLFSRDQKTIWDVVKKVYEGGGDIDKDIEPVQTSVENLSLIPGDLYLYQFESMLADSSFNAAASGTQRGFFDTSAIDRYLNSLGIDQEIDIFVIDTSPSLGALNRAILLGSDYFVVPVMADAFSVQGIENLGTSFSRWKKNWKNTAKVMAQDREIPSNLVLQGEGIFIGYIVNNFNVYSKKTVQRQDEWRNKIPIKIKEFLSDLSKNGLATLSCEHPLADIQDYGMLTAISMDKNKAITKLTTSDDTKLNIKGTKDLAEKANREITTLATNIIEILAKY